MKKQKFNAKLTLGKETIANLNSHAMTNIKGGYIADQNLSKKNACTLSVAEPACMNP